MKQQESKIFKQGLCFAKLFIFFLIGCIFGTYYEQLLNFITTGQWSNRSGLLFGPLNPIYGIPAIILLMILAKGNNKRGIIKTYIYSALISGVAEYIIGVSLELFFGVKFWDYTGYFLNIDGKTTIPFMLFWGLLGLLLLKFIYPIISDFLEKIPHKIAQPIYVSLLVFIIFDILITYSAFVRMSLRNIGEKPYTIVGRFYDEVFTDEYMSRKFPQMTKISDI